MNNILAVAVCSSVFWTVLWLMINVSVFVFICLNFCSSACFTDPTSAFQHSFTGLKLHLGINTKGHTIRKDL